MPGVPTHEPDSDCETPTGSTDRPTDGQTVADDAAVVVAAAAPDSGGNAAPPDAAAATETSGTAESESAPAAPATRSRRRRNRNRRPRRQRQEPIAAVPPDLSATREFTGTLNEIIPVINLTALGYADDGPMAMAMAKALLGSRWADQFGRITVYAPRAGANQTESYTALIPAGLISDSRSIKQGITVAVKLTGVDVSDRRRDWYCDDFQAVE